MKLTKNYRSHNAILKYPNERFYSNELESCGDKGTIDYFLGSPLLVSNKFPVVFHAMSGKDDREASSPSFFNIEEVLQVKAYVEALRSDRQFRVGEGISCCLVLQRLTQFLSTYSGSRHRRHSTLSRSMPENP